MKNSYACLLALSTLLAGPAVSSHAQALDEALALRAETELSRPITATRAEQAQASGSPAIADPGSTYVIKKAMGLHANSILYLLERPSDQAQAWVEIKDRGPAPRDVAANTVSMANALGAKLLLSDTGDEVTLPTARRASARRRPVAAP